ncbi:MAG: DNA polymerase III subunit [Nitrospira sp.]|nr:DNA polymerase III subunit [Nitrospira sp.]
MAFKDIIGQDRAVSIILRTIHRGRLPSSYLFAGESGIGKKFTAINLAKTLNCQNPNPPIPPLLKGGEGGFDKGHGWGIDCCDTCFSCRKIDAKTHPDFLFISPQGGQIRIEEIRAINDILSFKPFEGKKKIVILDEADTMNPYAANAFLKTLEEPSEGSLIILISSHPDLLPDTIRSRCSRINFTPLSNEDCRRVIERVCGHKSNLPCPPSEKGGKGGFDSQITTLVRLSMGRPGLAISEDLIDERKWFMKLLQGMNNTEKDGWSSREEMERWFDLLFILLRDIVIIKVTQDGKNLIHSDLQDYVKRLSNVMDLKVIIENYQKLNTLRGYFIFNLNKSLIWNYTGALLREMNSWSFE